MGGISTTGLHDNNDDGDNDNEDGKAATATTGAADNNQLKSVAKEIVAAEAAVADVAMPAAIMLKVATVTALRRRRQRLCGSDGDPRQ